MAEVQDELARLAALPAHRLRIEWRRQFRSEPLAALSRDLLLRAITYEVQERAYGGLSQAAKRTLRVLATEGADGAFRLTPTLKPGVRLVREWRGSQARAMIEKAAKHRPNDGAIVDSLGWVMLRQGQTTDAVSTLERAVELDPQDASINGHLGDATGRRAKTGGAYQWILYRILAHCAEGSARVLIADDDPMVREVLVPGS